MQIHTVKIGEDLVSIAANYGINPQKLAEINGISITEKLTVGREILVIIPTKTYTTRKGDTKEEVSKRFGIGVCDFAGNSI